MIVIAGSVQAAVRIDMTMPGRPEENRTGAELSPWEREAYGDGGRFGSMTSVPSGDPMKDRITVSFGGCAYNVAKYLARKGYPVRFLCVAGDDPLGMAAVADLKKAGVDTSGIVMLDRIVGRSEGSEGPVPEKEEPAPQTGAVREVASQTIPGHLGGSLTSVRVVARNFLGDVEFWRVDERILDEFSPQILESMMESAEVPDMVFADGDLPADTLRALGEICRRDGIDLYFDPASIDGARRACEVMDLFNGIMPGRREAEEMSGLQILSAQQLEEAGRFFTEKGIGRIVVTMKGGGLYYRDDSDEGVIRPERVIRYAETDGAGDVTAAALIEGFIRGDDIGTAAEGAMRAAAEYLADVVDERRY